MKKKIIFIATFMVIVATAVAVVSCKKERHDQNANGSEQTVQTADNMDEYLMAFKKKLLSAEKGGETISLEQAERDLGNLLNFDFGDANYVTNELRHDTIHVSLCLCNSVVELSQLAVTYNYAIEKLLNAYNEVEIPEKSVLSISCHINQEAKKDEAIDVKLILTTRGLRDFYQKPVFDSTDNWRVWEQLGKCDGTCVGDDHVSILNKAYQNNRPLLDCHNGRLYYTDIHDQCFLSGNDYPEHNSNNYHNYGSRLWSGFGYEVIENCIDYQEMTYYYNNFCQIMANEAWRPEGHVIKSVDTCFLEPFVSVNPQHFYTFCCYYTTGKPNCTSVGPDY